MLMPIRPDGAAGERARSLRIGGVQEPYIVTCCNHVFCMKHQNEDAIKESTCPGCGQHQPANNGLQVAQYRLDKGQEHHLNGLHPDAILEVTNNALSFWISQERLGADYYRMRFHKAEERKEQLKAEWRRVHDKMEQRAAALQRECEAAEHRNEELKHEMQLLQGKHQEQAHKVRVLQERVVGDRKRLRGGSEMGSPIRGDGSLTPEREHAHADLGHAVRSPLHAPAAGGGPARVGLGPPLRASTPLSSPARHGHRGGAGLPGGLGLGGGTLGGGDFGGSSSVRRLGLGSSLQHSGGTGMGSRLGTPIHRSASFLTPSALGGGGLGGSGGSWGGRR